MKLIRVTLVGDGSSDKLLMPILETLLDLHCPDAYKLQFAEGIGHGPLNERLQKAQKLFPCDLLFIHRDSENRPSSERETEIAEALKQLRPRPASIPVIPVRMSESWLLIDESAIRGAAGNPTGTMDLKLPSVKAIENIPDPKARLLNCIELATNLSARRRRQFNVSAARHRVSELLQDYENLRKIPSFDQTEKKIKAHFLQASLIN